MSKGYLKDIFYLDICKSGHSLFYSRTAQYRDSLIEAEKLRGLDGFQVLNTYSSVPIGEEWYIDKRFIDGRLLYTSKVVKYYRYEEPLVMPEWTFLEDSLTILGFTCKKATAVVEGRSWTVWYSPEIPISDGPWMFWGIPGLILYAIDNDEYFVFKCTSVGALKEPIEVILPSDNKNIISALKDKILQLEEIKVKDPLLLLENDNITIKVMSPVRTKKRPYLPIIKR